MGVEFHVIFGDGSRSGFDLYAKFPRNLGLELAFNLSC